ncbi:hypothetical protein BD413DRAFT_616152 [Trametes elegans]|nr:hypothetical protein BD413DRAFT_616152 [Trametes elegans]
MSEIDGYTPSPSSSPSLAPIDSSPPSSPSFTAIYTPPASPGAQDPFAGSTKSSKRPRIYERDESRKLKIDAFNPHSSTSRGRKDVLTRAVNEDETTPTRVVDPFSASAKRTWRPPTYEQKKGRVLSTDSATSASSSLSHAYGAKGHASPTPANRGNLAAFNDPESDFVLSDDDLELPRLRTRTETKEEVEQRLWDEEITAAIDKVNGTIDLSGTPTNKGPISHIPPSIGDLESFVALSPHNPSSVPSSPKHSTTPLPLQPLASDASTRPFTRATTLPATAFNDAFFLKSKDGERLRGTPAARAASLHSVAQPVTQLRRREIHIFLANNTITRLPAELFRVSSITVLSLRANALTSVPPQIAQLTSLKELNLAQNRLRWLPAEMLGMHLASLNVAANPWIAPPTQCVRTEAQRPEHSDSGSEVRPSVPTSETVVHFIVPPLTELCFRVLFAPYPPPNPALHPHPTHNAPSSSELPTDPSPSALGLHPDFSTSTQSPDRSASHNPPQLSPSPHARSLTMIEAAYALPITEEIVIGPAVLATLRACVPAAVAKPPTAAQLSGPSKVRRDDGQRDVHASAPHHERSSPRGSSHRGVGRDTDEDPPAISVCRSPAHRGEARVPVFVHHAEERFTWEKVIAGVRISAEGGGGVGVPVRRRGCSRGCLAFLDPPPPPPPPHGGASEEAPMVEGAGEGEVEMDLDGDGEEVEMREVRFEGGLADPEDFEEGF